MVWVTATALNIGHEMGSVPRNMSAIGPKQTSVVAAYMSAFGGKADMTVFGMSAFAMIAFMVILLTGYQVAAQPHLEARTSAMILDANGNSATLKK